MATQVVNSRLLRDANLATSLALPAASSNNTTSAIDIGSGPFNPEAIEVEVSIPAMSAHVTTSSNVVITLYSGATSGSLAATNPAITITVPGVTSTGSAASVVRFKLPPGTARFIGFNQACGATDNLTGTTISYQVLV